MPPGQMYVASGPVPSVTCIISSSLRFSAKPSLAVRSEGESVAPLLVPFPRMKESIIDPWTLPIVW